MSKDKYGNSSVSAALEKPTRKAELRIVLVDPTGIRPALVWRSDPGSSTKHHGAIARWIPGILRRKHRIHR
jgi:hypothetical protein